MSLKKSILDQALRAIDAKIAFKLYVEDYLSVINDSGATFHFRKFDKHLLKSVSNPPQKYNIDPLLPPYHPLIYVQNMFNQNIIINKFMHSPGHVVFSADDPDLQQGSKLNKSDFSMMAHVLREFKNGVAYYNSGIDAGCTQLHKHIQFAPTIHNPLLDLMSLNAKLPFVYYNVNFKSLDSMDISDAYKELFNQAKEYRSRDYNFIVSSRNAVLIPRQKAQHETGIVVNSLGMCGHLAIWDWSHPNIIKNPLKIITNLCFPVK